MHLLIRNPVQRHVEHGWRERAGNGGGGEQDAADGVQCAWMPALGDSADVPQYSLLSVQIGGPDEKQAPFVIGLCQVSQHRLVHITGDGLEQRGIVSHRVVEQRGSHGTRQEHAFRCELGINGSELRIVA
jgi:hypothetical protein